MKNTVSITNKALGTSFEEDFAQMLYEEGFWVHLLTQNAAGQPADIIAVKKKKALLIDCKVCSDDRFPLSRIEDNQHSSMELWRDCGNGEAWFAFKISQGQIFMIPHYSMKALTNFGDKASLSVKDMAEYGVTYEKWIKKICKSL